jgi:hypothetical protein
MKTFSLLFALLMLGREAVLAADKTLVDEKNQSVFAMEPNERNPFWPIGWKPAAKAGPETAGPEIPASVFLVSSITMGQRERFAIINGKVMQEGQQFGLQMGNQTYQITLKEIQDGQVVLLRRDEEIIAPLRRK